MPDIEPFSSDVMEVETCVAADQNTPTTDSHANLHTTDENLHSPATDEKYKCEDELDSDDVELTSLTKQDYINICKLVHGSLKSLLADEMTSKYANFSLLFKKFRQTYAQNLKLQSKVFELESAKRLLESKTGDLLGILEEGETREKEMQSSILMLRNAVAEAEKQKNVVETQRDEFKAKLDQIPEEILMVTSF